MEEMRVQFREELRMAHEAVAVVTRERDEARAEVERLKGELRHCYEDPESAYAGQRVLAERDALRARCERLEEAYDTLNAAWNRQEDALRARVAKLEAVAKAARACHLGDRDDGQLVVALAALDAEGGER